MAYFTQKDKPNKHKTFNDRDGTLGEAKAPSQYPQKSIVIDNNAVLAAPLIT